MSETAPAGKKTAMKSITMVVLICVGIGVFFILQSKDASFNLRGTPRITKGMAAPEFAFSNMDGQTVSLSDFKGKVVFLNIWATWCPPCVEEMPSMEKLHQALNGKDFAMVAVSIDDSGADAVAPFIKKHNLNFLVLTDPKGTMKTLYQTTGVPETFIIGKDGVVLEKIVGPRNWATPKAISTFNALIQAK